MKNIRLKILLLVSLSIFCLNVSAMENGLVKKELRENNGVITKTEKQENMDQGKIFNVVLRSANFDKFESKIYFSYILKALEYKFKKENGFIPLNMFKDLKIDKNNDEIYISFEATIPNDQTKKQLESFLNEIFNDNDTENTKVIMKNIINEYGKNVDIEREKNKIIEEEINKLNQSRDKLEEEYRKEKVLSSPIKGLFKTDSMFNDIENMLNDSIFSREFSNFVEDNEIEEIKKETEEEEKNRERNVINNKIEEKIHKLKNLKNNEINLKNIRIFIDDIKNINSNGIYKKVTQSYSAISKNAV